METSYFSPAATSSSPPSGPAWRCGARSSLPACTATRRPGRLPAPAYQPHRRAGQQGRDLGPSLVGLNPAAWRRAPPDNRAPCCPISWPPAAGASAPSSCSTSPRASCLGFATTAIAYYLRKTGVGPAEIGAFVGSFTCPGPSSGPLAPWWTCSAPSALATVAGLDHGHQVLMVATLAVLVVLTCPRSSAFHGRALRPQHHWRDAGRGHRQPGLQHTLA